MSIVVGVAKRSYNWANKRIARALLPLFEPISAKRHELRSLGTGEGAWTVPVDLITPGAICYCVGVGLDNSFDLALAKECSARVYAFDPTPRTIEFMSKFDLDTLGVKYLPVGVWNVDTQLKFFAPMNRAHQNYSIRDIHATDEYFLADCRRLATIMASLSHSKLTLLKIDIEGAWYEVLSDMLSSGIVPSIVCAEFDSPTSLAKVLRLIRRLRTVGLELAHRERDNFLFIDRSAVAGVCG